MNLAPIKRTKIASISTDTTSVTIPEGLLEAGTYYFATVNAITFENWTAKSPNRLGVTTATSTTPSGLFTP